MKDFFNVTVMHYRFYTCLFESLYWQVWCLVDLRSHPPGRIESGSGEGRSDFANRRTVSPTWEYGKRMRNSIDEYTRSRKGIILSEILKSVELPNCFLIYAH